MTDAVKFLTCPWCTSRTPDTEINCRQCGGPLPPIGGVLGEPPPPPPRELPKGFQRRAFTRGAPLLMIGGLFAAIGFPLGALFITVSVLTGDLLFGVIGGIIGGIFTLIGSVLGVIGFKTARCKVEPFKRGLAATGKIVDVHDNENISINGRHPKAIVYQFEANGSVWEGQGSSWKYEQDDRLSEGRTIHVLYLADDPEQSVVYPPIT